MMRTTKFIRSKDMYIFEACYIDSSEKEIFRSIKFPEQFFEHKRDVYIFAMDEAFDMLEDGETLLSVTFVSC